MIEIWRVWNSCYGIMYEVRTLWDKVIRFQNAGTG
jgi:hypothetical protein